MRRQGKDFLDRKKDDSIMIEYLLVVCCQTVLLEFKRKTLMDCPNAEL